MKLSDENDKMFGSRYLISDHGMAILVKLEDGTVGCEGYSVPRGRLTQEEKDMYDHPQETWDRFFSHLVETPPQHILLRSGTHVEVDNKRYLLGQDRSFYPSDSHKITLVATRDVDERHEMLDLFHALWGKATTTSNYDKQQWKRLQELLER